LLERVDQVRPLADRVGVLPPAFREAMDDDLNVSGALAVVHDTVRAANTALDDGDLDGAAELAAAVVAMTDILGVNPLDPHWAGATTSGQGDATSALDALVQAQLAARQSARAARDFAAADAIRDQLTTAGIAIEDTPSGPRWSLARHPDAPGARPFPTEGLTWPAAPAPRGGPQERQGAHRGLGRPTPSRPRREGPDPQGRRPREAHRPQAQPTPGRLGAGCFRGSSSGLRGSGSGGRYAARPASGGRPSSGGRPGSSGGRSAGSGRPGNSRPTNSGRRGKPSSEIVAGRNSVVEALRADIPAATLYIASRIDSDDRVREALTLATRRGIPMLECPRAELDRITDGAVHQGLALQVPPYTYADPDDSSTRRPPACLVVALDGITDSAQPGAILRSVAAFGGHGVVVPSAGRSA
jgi:hypothetical protein